MDEIKKKGYRWRDFYIVGPDGEYVDQIEDDDGIVHKSVKESKRRYDYNEARYGVAEQIGFWNDVDSENKQLYKNSIEAREKAQDAFIEKHNFYSFVLNPNTPIDSFSTTMYKEFDEFKKRGKLDENLTLNDFVKNTIETKGGATLEAFQGVFNQKRREEKGLGEEEEKSWWDKLWSDDEEDSIISEEAKYTPRNQKLLQDLFAMGRGAEVDPLSGITQEDGLAQIGADTVMGTPTGSAEDRGVTGGLDIGKETFETQSAETEQQQGNTIKDVIANGGADQDALKKSLDTLPRDQAQKTMEILEKIKNGEELSPEELEQNIQKILADTNPNNKARAKYEELTGFQKRIQEIESITKGKYLGFGDNDLTDEENAAYDEELEGLKSKVTENIKILAEYKLKRMDIDIEKVKELGNKKYDLDKVSTKIGHGVQQVLFLVDKLIPGGDPIEHMASKMDGWNDLKESDKIDYSLFLMEKMKGGLNDVIDQNVFSKEVFSVVGARDIVNSLSMGEFYDALQIEDVLNKKLESGAPLTEADIILRNVLVDVKKTKDIGYEGEKSLANDITSGVVHSMSYVYGGGVGRAVAKKIIKTGVALSRGKRAAIVLTKTGAIATGAAIQPEFVNQVGKNLTGEIKISDNNWYTPRALYEAVSPLLEKELSDINGEISQKKSELSNATTEEEKTQISKELRSLNLEKTQIEKDKKEITPMSTGQAVSQAYQASLVEYISEQAFGNLVSGALTKASTKLKNTPLGKTIKKITDPITNNKVSKTISTLLRKTGLSENPGDVIHDLPTEVAEEMFVNLVPLIDEDGIDFEDWEGKLKQLTQPEFYAQVILQTALMQTSAGVYGKATEKVQRTFDYLAKNDRGNALREMRETIKLVKNAKDEKELLEAWDSQKINNEIDVNSYNLIIKQYRSSGLEEKANEMEQNMFLQIGLQAVRNKEDYNYISTLEKTIKTGEKEGYTKETLDNMQSALDEMKALQKDLKNLRSDDGFYSQDEIIRTYSIERYNKKKTEETEKKIKDLEVKAEENRANLGQEKVKEIETKISDLKKEEETESKKIDEEEIFRTKNVDTRVDAYEKGGFIVDENTESKTEKGIVTYTFKKDKVFKSLEDAANTAINIAPDIENKESVDVLLNSKESKTDGVKLLKIEQNQDKNSPDYDFSYAYFQDPRDKTKTLKVRLNHKYGVVRSKDEKSLITKVTFESEPGKETTTQKKAKATKGTSSTAKLKSMGDDKKLPLKTWIAKQQEEGTWKPRDQYFAKKNGKKTKKGKTTTDKTTTGKTTTGKTTTNIRTTGQKKGASKNVTSEVLGYDKAEYTVEKAKLETTKAGDDYVDFIEESDQYLIRIFDDGTISRKLLMPGEPWTSFFDKDIEDLAEQTNPRIKEELQAMKEKSEELFGKEIVLDTEDILASIAPTEHKLPQTSSEILKQRNFSEVKHQAGEGIEQSIREDDDELFVDFVTKEAEDKTFKGKKYDNFDRLINDLAVDLQKLPHDVANQIDQEGEVILNYVHLDKNKNILEAVVTLANGTKRKIPLDLGIQQGLGEFDQIKPSESEKPSADLEETKKKIKKKYNDIRDNIKKERDEALEKNKKEHEKKMGAASIEDQIEIDEENFILTHEIRDEAKEKIRKTQESELEEILNINREQPSSTIPEKKEKSKEQIKKEDSIKKEFEESADSIKDKYEKILAKNKKRLEEEIKGVDKETEKEIRLTYEQYDISAKNSYEIQKKDIDRQRDDALQTVKQEYMKYRDISDPKDPSKTSPEIKKLENKDPLKQEPTSSEPKSTVDKTLKDQDADIKDVFAGVEEEVVVKKEEGSTETTEKKEPTETDETEISDEVRSLLSEKADLEKKIEKLEAEAESYDLTPNKKLRLGSYKVSLSKIEKEIKKAKSAKPKKVDEKTNKAHKKSPVKGKSGVVGSGDIKVITFDSIVQTSNMKEPGARKSKAYDNVDSLRKDLDISEDNESFKTLKKTLSGVTGAIRVMEIRENTKTGKKTAKLHVGGKLHIPATLSWDSGNKKWKNEEKARIPEITRHKKNELHKKIKEKGKPYEEMFHTEALLESKKNLDLFKKQKIKNDSDIKYMKSMKGQSEFLRKDFAEKFINKRFLKNEKKINITSFKNKEDFNSQWKNKSSIISEVRKRATKKYVEKTERLTKAQMDEVFDDAEIKFRVYIYSKAKEMQSKSNQAKKIKNAALEIPDKPSIEDTIVNKEGIKLLTFINNIFQSSPSFEKAQGNFFRIFKPKKTKITTDENGNIINYSIHGDEGQIQFDKDEINGLIEMMNSYRNVLIKEKNNPDLNFQDMIIDLMRILGNKKLGLLGAYELLGEAWDAAEIKDSNGKIIKSNWEDSYKEEYTKSERNPKNSHYKNLQNDIPKINEATNNVIDKKEKAVNIKVPEKESYDPTLHLNHESSLYTDLGYISHVDPDGNVVISKRIEENFKKLLDPTKNLLDVELSYRKIDFKEWKNAHVYYREEEGFSPVKDANGQVIESQQEITFYDWMKIQMEKKGLNIENSHDIETFERDHTRLFTDKVPIMYTVGDKDVAYMHDVSFFTDRNIRDGDPNNIYDDINNNSSAKIRSLRQKHSQIRQKIYNGKLEKAKIVYSSSPQFVTLPKPSSLEIEAPNSIVTWGDANGNMTTIDGDLISSEDIVNFESFNKEVTLSNGEKVHNLRYRNMYLTHYSTVDGKKKYVMYHTFRLNEQQENQAFEEDLESLRWMSLARKAHKNKKTESYTRNDKEYSISVAEADKIQKKILDEIGVNIYNGESFAELIQAMVSVVKKNKISVALKDVESNIFGNSNDFRQNTSQLFKKGIPSIQKKGEEFETIILGKNYEGFLKKRLQTNIKGHDIGTKEKPFKTPSIQRKLTVLPIEGNSLKEHEEKVAEYENRKAQKEMEKEGKTEGDYQEVPPREKIVYETKEDEDFAEIIADLKEDIYEIVDEFSMNENLLDTDDTHFNIAPTNIEDSGKGSISQTLPGLTLSEEKALRSFLMAQMLEDGSSSDRVSKNLVERFVKGERKIRELIDTIIAARENELSKKKEFQEDINLLKSYQGLLSKYEKKANIISKNANNLIEKAKKDISDSNLEKKVEGKERELGAEADTTLFIQKVVPEIKKVFATIPTNEKTELGLPKYESFKTMYDYIHNMIGSAEFKTPSFEKMMSIMMENKGHFSWIEPLVGKLNNLPSHIQNAFVSNMHSFPANAKFAMVTLRDGKKELQFYHSNSRNAHQRLLNYWEDSFKRSVLGQNGIINIEEVKRLKAVWSSFFTKKGTLSKRLKTNEVRNWLESFGINLSDDTWFDLVKNGLSLRVKNKNTRVSFRNLFAYTGKGRGSYLFSSLDRYLDAIIRASHGGEDISYIEDTFNMPFKGMSGILQKISQLEAKHNTSLLSTTRRVGNKTMREFELPTFLAQKVNHLKNNKKYVESLSKLSYNSTSKSLELLRTDDKFREEFGVGYVDIVAIRKQGESPSEYSEVIDVSRLDVMTISRSGLQSEGLIKLAERYYGIAMKMADIPTPTNSDKKKMTFVKNFALELYENQEELIVSKDGKISLGDNIRRILYEQLVLPEIKRALKARKIHKNSADGINIKNYDKGAFRINAIPAVNTLEGTSGDTLIQALISDEYDEKKITAEFAVVIMDYLEGSVMKEADKSVKFIEDNVENRNKEDGLNSEKFLNKREQSLTIDQRRYLAELDYSINYMISNANVSQMISGDPALYFKSKGEPLSNSKDDQNAMSRDLGTNFGKRAASEVASGEVLAQRQGENKNYIQLFLKDFEGASESIKEIVKIRYGESILNEKYQGVSYSTIFDALGEGIIEQEVLEHLELKFPKIAGFFNIESSDAQEYTTGEGHIYQMYLEGKISKDTHDKYKAKLDAQYKAEMEGKEINPKDYLTKEEMEIILQPTKPVFSGTVIDEKQDVNRFVYIKTSAIPLLPQFTKGKLLDPLRKKMEELQKEKGMNVRASFQTGNKVGANNNTIDVLSQRSLDSVFQEDNGVPSYYTVLPREYLKIQQQVPAKNNKEKPNMIVIGSQVFKLLGGDHVKDIKSFEFQGEIYTGEELMAKLSDIFSSLIAAKSKNLGDKLKLDENFNERDEKESFNAFRKLLVAEAIKRGYPQVEIDALNEDTIKNDDGTEFSSFTIPLWLSSQGQKYESLCTSIINNSILKQEMPGLGFVCATDAGIELTEDLEGVDLSTVIHVNNWDGSTLKSYRTDENGETHNSQILVPSTLKHNGKLIDLFEGFDLTAKGRQEGKFLYRDDNGIIQVKKYMIPPELMEQFCFRIPSSSKAFGSSVEIVGFLPPQQGNVIICPKNFVTQFGFDFDVDKLYVYQKHTIQRADGSIRVLTEESEQEYYDHQKARRKELTTQLNEIYKKEDAEERLALFSEGLYEFEEEIIEVMRKKNTLKEKIEEIQALIKEGYKNFGEDFRKKLLENQIIDIHQTVYSNSDMQPYINTVLSLDDAQNQADAIDEARKSKEQEDFNLYSSNYQIDTLNLGSTGAKGISIYASYVSFHALCQQVKDPLVLLEGTPGNPNTTTEKEIRIGSFVSKGKLGQINNLVSENATEIEKKLYEIYGGMISDQLNVLTNTATDNAKLLIMARAGMLHIDNVTVDALLASLGFNVEIKEIKEENYDSDNKFHNKTEIDGKIVYFTKMSIPYLLHSQPIIKEFFNRVSHLNSISGKQQYGVFDKVRKEFSEKYPPKLSQEGASPERSNLAFTTENLLDQIKGERDNDFQMRILSFYLDLLESSRNAQKLMAITDMKDLGKNISESEQKYEDLIRLIDSNNSNLLIKNGFNLLGRVEEIPENGEVTGLEIGYNKQLIPETNQGFAIIASLKASNKIFNNYFPHKNPHMKDITFQLSQIFSVHPDRKNQYLEFKTKIFEGFKQYVTSNNELGLSIKNVSDSRENLLVDDLDNTSLSTYLANFFRRRNSKDNTAELTKVLKEKREKKKENNAFFTKQQFELFNEHEKNIKILEVTLNKIKEGEDPNKDTAIKEYEERIKFENDKLNEGLEKIKKEKRERSRKIDDDYHVKFYLIDENYIDYEKNGTFVFDEFSGGIDFVKNNDFIKFLNFKKGLNGNPSLIEFNRSEDQSFNEANIIDSFKELLTKDLPLPTRNGVEYTTKTLALELMIYSFFSGGIVPKATQFHQYIPIDLLNDVFVQDVEGNKTPVLNLLQRFDPRHSNSKDKTQMQPFILQFIQHNPDLLPKIYAKNAWKNNIQIVGPGKFKVKDPTKEMESPKYFVLVNNKAKSYNKKDRFTLYEKQEDLTYSQVEVLGQDRVSEYDYNKSNVKSVFGKNEEKLRKLVKKLRKAVKAINKLGKSYKKTDEDRKVIDQYEKVLFEYYKTGIKKKGKKSTTIKSKTNHTIITNADGSQYIKTKKKKVYPITTSLIEEIDLDKKELEDIKNLSLKLIKDKNKKLSKKSTTDSKPPTTDSKPSTTDSKPSTTDSKTTEDLKDKIKKLENKLIKLNEEISSHEFKIFLGRGTLTKEENDRLYNYLYVEKRKTKKELEELTSKKETGGKATLKNGNEIILTKNKDKDKKMIETEVKKLKLTSVLDNIIRSNYPPKYAYISQLASSLKLGSDFTNINLEVVNDNSIPYNGKYKLESDGSGTITINEAKLNGSQIAKIQTILHELTHALTVPYLGKHINKDGTLNKDAPEEVKNINNVFLAYKEHMKEAYPKEYEAFLNKYKNLKETGSLAGNETLTEKEIQRFYSTTSLKEFMAVALGNNEHFLAQAKQIKYQESGLLDRFGEFLVNLLDKIKNIFETEPFALYGSNIAKEAIVQSLNIISHKRVAIPPNYDFDNMPDPKPVWTDEQIKEMDKVTAEIIKNFEDEFGPVEEDPTEVIKDEDPFLSEEELATKREVLSDIDEEVKSNEGDNELDPNKSPEIPEEDNSKDEFGVLTPEEQIIGNNVSFVEGKESTANEIKSEMDNQEKLNSATSSVKPLEGEREIEQKGTEHFDLNIAPTLSTSNTQSTFDILEKYDVNDRKKEYNSYIKPKGLPSLERSKKCD